MTEPTLRKDRPTWLTKSLARIKKVPKNETRDGLSAHRLGFGTGHVNLCLRHGGLLFNFGTSDLAVIPCGLYDY